MGWEMATETRPIARKEHKCDAARWICRAGYGESEYEPEDWQTIQKAQAEGWKILPGTRYIRVDGKCDGDFTSFKAREDLDAICKKYELYDDDF